MQGVALVLDLLKKNPISCSQNALHSYDLFSAAAAASAAATAVAAVMPFPPWTSGISVAHCDAGSAFPQYDIPSLLYISGNIAKHGTLQTTKEYYFELKPLWSAFALRSLALTSMRSFLVFYLPLIEPRTNLDESNDDFLRDEEDERRVDFIVPLQKSIKQIIKETTAVTIRRILERITAHYASQRTTWKLLKDVPKSTVRKAERGLPTTVYFLKVSRTTFRGHFLGVAASFLLQSGIEVYNCLLSIYKSKQELETEEFDQAERVKILRQKISSITLRCSASLVFASIGAGIGAIVFHPSTGQWIGCAVGDLAGPIIISACVDKVLQVDL